MPFAIAVLPVPEWTKQRRTGKYDTKNTEILSGDRPYQVVQQEDRYVEEDYHDNEEALKQQHTGKTDHELWW